MRNQKQGVLRAIGGAAIIAVLMPLIQTAQGAAINSDDVFEDAIQAVRAVEKNGVGNETAVKAMKVLNTAGADKIPALLEAMDGVNPIALNWLRAAINQAARRAPDNIPLDKIKSYFADTTHHPMGRKLAFDMIAGDDGPTRKKMIAGLIDDPSLPLRYLAIAQLVEEADAAQETDPIAATGKLAYAFSKARDTEQVTMIGGKLESLGIEVDLQDQFGFLASWSLVGSFDNKEMAGFDVAYGPENDVVNVDLTASYTALDGKPTTWQKVTTDDSVGNVDLNKIIGKVKGATVYAYTTFKSDEERKAQIRIGSANATKIWLNGKLVMSNEIYHNSNSIDKFIGDVTLAKGENKILMKVCQNEQTQPWAQDWQFQFRICDSTGKAIPEFTSPAAGN